MSFDFNSSNLNLSNIQATAKTCSGGGGNTGYFQRGKKDEEDENIVTFTKDYPEDSFESEKETKEDSTDKFIDEIFNFFSKLLNSIKNFFIKKR